MNEEWEVQIKKGILDLVLLEIISRKQMYGRDIINHLNKNGIETSEGTIYPLLAKLKLKKYVTTQLLESKEGPARKYYKITDRGTSQLILMRQSWKKMSANINKLINSKK